MARYRAAVAAALQRVLTEPRFGEMAQQIGTKLRQVGVLMGTVWWEKVGRNHGKQGGKAPKAWKTSEIWKMWKMWKVLPNKPGQNMLNVMLKGQWVWGGAPA